MRFADTHCHLNFSEFDQSMDCLMASCQESSIDLFVVPSITSDSWPAVLELADRYSQIIPALGLHPCFMVKHSLEDIEKLDLYLECYKSKVVAVGEIGLDVQIDDLSQQTYYFEKQLALASKHSLPVVLHSRKMHGKIVKSLKKYNLVGGVIHAFSGSKQDLDNYVSLGVNIGVGGVITWPRAEKTRKAIQSAPIESLVLETDSPDMPVFGEAKGEATPLNVLKVFDVLCQIRSESADVLAATLWQNSLDLFGLDVP